MRSVLFDLDDTLFDHRRARRAAVRTMIEELDPRPRPALARVDGEYQRLLEELHPKVLAGRMAPAEARRERFRRLAEWLGRPRRRAEVDRLIVRTGTEYRRNRFAVPGVPALLRHLRRTSTLGVVTNNLLEEQERKLRAIGLRSQIDALVASEAVGVAKPDPEIFRLALERLGTPAREAVMVGDSWPVDIVGARRAGIAAIWFDRERRPTPPRPRAVRLESFRPMGVALNAVGRLANE